MKAKFFKLFLLIPGALFMFSCTNGKLLPIKNGEFQIAVPVQQEVISKAVFDAISKVDFKKFAKQKAYVEVVGGFSPFAEYIRGMTELKLARDGVTVLPVTVSTENNKIVNYPKKADLRVLVIAEVAGADFKSRYKEFFILTWGYETLYQGKCDLTVAVQPLNKGDKLVQEVKGTSGEFKIEDGYVYSK